ncbi:MAG: restriction endonuclease [Nitrospiraceae bacterium]|nr:MAG: restriction endonuclease [Nitrospiraceae bacterium]
MHIKVKKASGVIENFNAMKLLDSLVRSGASREQADEIIEQVVSQVKPYTSTKKIFRLAHKYLRQFNRASVLRYSLKNALMRLGPTGYPFERYVGELLRQYGYRVRVGLIMDGKCVRHEVDVYAERDREAAFIECKFRNSAERTPDVKVAMYFHSRFLDLRAAIGRRAGKKQYRGWLVTNTRFTSDALQYGSCSGLILKSWRYPEKEGLEQMIEEKKMYPVTVMSGFTSAQMRKLMEHRIILMKDLAAMAPRDIARLLSVSEKRAGDISEQADQLCFC